jgi:3-oxoadipate enol-lactonase
MPIAEIAGLRVNYELAGAANAPILVLSNSLGSHFGMWDLQRASLEKKFRLLRYDTRGHGRTSVTPGPYTIELLGRDVIGLLDHLKVEKAYFCGLSMGGAIGIWLGLNAGQRLNKLALCNTAAKIGTAEGWDSRIENVKKGGMKSIAPAVVERWLTPEFRERSPELFACALRMLECTSPEGYIASCEAVRDFDARDAVASIRTPTLVIGGAKDPATPPSDTRALAEAIPGARYVELDTSHLSNIEAADRFTSELIGFFLP